MSYWLIESYQVPHAFQDVLGAETTPTLCYSIPAFTAFIELWTQLASERPDWEVLIQPGLDKLQDYQKQLPQTPAYVVAMGEIIHICIFTVSNLLAGIDPGNKLSFYRDQSSAKFTWARRLFLKAVSQNLLDIVKWFIMFF